MAAFYYATTPLPPAMTKGKTQVQLEIRSSGPIWGYGRTFEQYQKPMDGPSRAIYGVATHLDGCFVPSVDEKQGAAPKETSAEPGEEVLAAVKQRVNGTLDGLLKSSDRSTRCRPSCSRRPITRSGRWRFRIRKRSSRSRGGRRSLSLVGEGRGGRLARPRDVESRLVRARAHRRCRAVGRAASRRHRREDRRREDAARAAWSEMFVASRDWLADAPAVVHESDAIYGHESLSFAPESIVAIDPQNAWPDERGQAFLTRPWGPSVARLRHADGSREAMGREYFQITEKGLSRELGYVGGYGEILGQMVDAYDATRDPAGKGIQRSRRRSSSCSAPGCFSATRCTMPTVIARCAWRQASAGVIPISRRPSRTDNDRARRDAHLRPRRSRSIRTPSEPRSRCSPTSSSSRR